VHKILGYPTTIASLDLSRFLSIVIGAFHHVSVATQLQTSSAGGEANIAVYIGQCTTSPRNVL